MATDRKRVTICLPDPVLAGIAKAVNAGHYGFAKTDEGGVHRVRKSNRSSVIAGCLREVLGIPHPEGTILPKKARRS